MRGPYGAGPPVIRTLPVRGSCVRQRYFASRQPASLPLFFPYCSIWGEYSGIGARLWMESAKTGGLPGLKKTSTCSQSHAGCGVQNSVNASARQKFSLWRIEYWFRPCCWFHHSPLEGQVIGAPNAHFDVKRPKNSRRVNAPINYNIDIEIILSYFMTNYVKSSR